MGFSTTAQPTLRKYVRALFPRGVEMFLTLVSFVSFVGGLSVLKKHAALSAGLLILAFFAFFWASYRAWGAEWRRATDSEAKLSCPAVAIECVSNPDDWRDTSHFLTLRDTKLAVRARDADCFGFRIEPLSVGNDTVSFPAIAQLLVGDAAVGLRPDIRTGAGALPRLHHDLTWLFTHGAAEDEGGVLVTAVFADKLGRPFWAQYRITFEPFEHRLSVTLVRTAPGGSVEAPRESTQAGLPADG